MPHYADGTEAKVGDHVTGKLFNTEGIRAGTIISITPGSEPRRTLSRTVRGEKHGSEGPAFVAFVCADYCDVDKLTKVG